MDVQQQTQGTPAQTHQLPPFNIMAKPVCGLCNLDCTYCYYLRKTGLYPDAGKMLMPDEVLESYIRQYMAAQPPHVDFGWQGGEPTLAGLDFFKRAVELQKTHAIGRQEVANALQTNGTTLDDEWGEFLAANKFLVGISIDGPPAWHDHFRKDRTGMGTFARAWRGLEILRKHRVQFNVLVTLNSRNAPYAGDIYRYFVNRGIDWLQFIPICETDDSGAVLDYCPTGKQYGKFLCDVFDIWSREDVGRVSVRLFDSILHVLVHGMATTCCQSAKCANAHVLEFNGDLYACDHFVEPRWRLGNILETPLVELLQSPLLSEFATLKTDRPTPCDECEFLAYCYGGCPKHHVGAERTNRFCEGYKMFFEHALPELKRLAEYIKRGQAPPPRPDAAPTRPAGPPAPPLAAAPPTARPGRNSPCPCGSGRKFKQCCGKR